MTLRERFGLGGLLLVAGAAAAATFVMRPFVPAVMASDSDSDGLSDAFENAFGTNPNDATTDGDSWNDWDEIFLYGTDPTEADTDGDMLDDHMDSDPLVFMSDTGGGSAASGSYSRNLTQQAWVGTSARDATGVLVHSGEFTHSLTLMQIDPGCGPAIPAVIHYASGVSNDGPLGRNWDSPLFARLVVQGDSDVEFHRGDGCMLEFDHPGGSPSTPFDYTSPAEGIFLTLTKVSGSAYALTDTHGNVKTFNAAGQITDDADRFGNNVVYAYSSGDLHTVTDEAGHVLTATWHVGKDRIDALTDSSSRAASFAFGSDNQLLKVTLPTSTEYPSGLVHAFTYSVGSGTATLNHNLVRAKDPKGQTWLRNEFDENDRVVKQYLGVDSSTLSYATGPTVTTVVDRAGNQRDHACSGALPTSLKEYSNRDVRASDPTYWETSFGHTSAGLLNKVVRPRGNRLDVSYDGNGNVTEVRRKETDTASSSGSDVVDAYEYDGDFNLMTEHTDPLGNVTTYALETTGGLTDKVVVTVTHPTVTYLAPDQTATETFTWNSRGQMVTHTDGEGKERTFVYFVDESGTGVTKYYLKKVVVDSGSGGLDLTTEWTYTNWGDRTSVTNPRGFTTTLDVNEYGWLIASESDSPQSYETLYEYDANGNLTEKSVENVDKTNTRDTGNPWWVTTYEYDQLNNRTAMTEEVTSSTTRGWTWSYTANEQLHILTKPEGNSTRFVYDERGLVYQKTRGYNSADASTATSAYDGNRNLTSWKNGRSKEWVHTYDLFDRKTKTTNPLTNYAEWIYDKNGNVTEQKRWEEAGASDVLMAHTKWSYDERDRQFKTEAGLKGVSTWSFLATTLTLDKRGLVAMVTDPRGKETDFEYDGARRRIGAVDALGNEVEWTLDANGNPTVIEEIETTGHTSPKTFVTEVDYDELDRREEERVVDETNASNEHTTTFKYTSLHVLVERVDAESNTTTWAHDGLGRVTEESIDLGSSTYKKRFWTYDDNDRLAVHEDDAGNDTVYDYNARDLCVEETYADTGVKTFGYDLADNLTDWEDPNGTVVEVTFDDNNRRTVVAVTRGSGVLGTEDETWYYDALDRVTECKDDDVTVQFTWDSLSRKKTEVSGPNPISSYGKTTSYTYDDAGNVTTLAYPDGSFSLTRTYDDVNRLTLVEDGGGTDIVAEEYFGAGGRAKKLTFGNTTTADHAYDGYRWLSDLDHKTSTPTTFAGYDLVRDAVGNILYEEWSHDSGKGHNYAYDKAYRLKKSLQKCNDPSAEHATPGSQTYVTKLEYNLSDDSDRSSVVTTPYGSGALTVNYTSNAVHEYTVVGGVNRAYDSNGNLTDDGTNDYEYDYRNQLVRVTRQSDSQVIGLYEYDCLGRRTKKTLEDDSSVRYYHDGHHEVEEYDGSGSLLRKYVYRDDIDSIAMMEAPDQADVDADLNTSELVRLFYHCDGRTNVARLTATAQTVVESYESDPYGNVTTKNQAGSTVSTSPVGNPFVFQRRRHDAESGLMYFRARHYDPQRGHWLQRDPLGFGPRANWREFCSSSPVGRIDPLGEDDKPKVVVVRYSKSSNPDPNKAAQENADAASAALFNYLESPGAAYVSTAQMDAVYKDMRQASGGKHGVAATIEGGGLKFATHAPGLPPGGGGGGEPGSGKSKWTVTVEDTPTYICVLPDPDPDGKSIWHEWLHVLFFWYRDRLVKDLVAKIEASSEEEAKAAGDNAQSEADAQTDPAHDAIDR